MFGIPRTSTLRASPYSEGIIHSRESRTTRRSPRAFLSAPPTALSGLSYSATSKRDSNQ